jgi:phosphatidylserine/phosphatidylglycerophosphate/cardiolipin synthase-like enzyme
VTDLPASLFELPTSSLESLETSLRGGALRNGVNPIAARQIIGEQREDIIDWLRLRQEAGIEAERTAELVGTVLVARERLPWPERLVDLIVSGPELDGLPSRETLPTILSLVEQATSEIFVIDYTIHGAQSFFERIADAMARVPDMRVTFCLDVQRGRNDTSMDSEILRRFRRKFFEDSWRANREPEIYYDPRSLKTNPTERASMHAKCVVVDRKTAFITSANLTDAAQRKNIELGVLVEHPPLAQRTVEYFEGLIQKGMLKPIPAM